jgi:ABC-2 type transport system ATP-binding protein
MTASATAALQLDQVYKSFGDYHAVDGVSVCIPPGMVYGFIGPNGAGKTTTLRMVVDIIRPDRGTVTVLGETDPAAIRPRIGYLPEERGMYVKMRTLEFVTYLGTLKGMTAGAARARGAELMQQLGLGEWQAATVDTLSKGMQQKLQFVATIVHDPELLILDEPFSGLDPVNVEVMTETILALRRRGRTVIFSTHMMDHAERLCDAIFMIHHGHKVLDGPLSEIKAHAPHRAIRLTCYGEKGFVRDLPYVARMREYGNDLEVFVQPGTPPQRLLRDVVERVEVSRFDVSDPSLYDIFLEQVAPERTHRIGADGSWVSTEPGTEASRGGAS